MKRLRTWFLILIFVWLIGQPLGSVLAADPTTGRAGSSPRIRVSPAFLGIGGGASPTAPPPPKATNTPKPPAPKPTTKPPKKPKKTATPTSRPPSGSYRTATPSPTATLSVTPTITATATLTPTSTPTATPIPGELHIMIYVDANRNNLMDDGEGVENLLLVASSSDWRVQAWTVQGVVLFQIPARFYDTRLLVQSPYLHWGETFDAPETDESVAVGVLRLTLPDFPVFLP